MKPLPILLLTLFTGACFGGQATPPNVLFIIVDDLGRQDVGAYGSEFHETPVIDQLARDGVLFTNAYAAHPRCVPSRVAMLSGRYPARYGVPGFQDRSEGPHALPLSTVTFGERLRDAGYRTAYIGKWHLGKEGGGPDVQGFDISLFAGQAGAPGSYFLPYEERRAGVSTPSFPPYDGGEEGEYLTDRLTDEAIRFVEQSADEPFLLVLAHYAVHTPIQAKPETAAEYREKAHEMGLKSNWDEDLVIDRTGKVKTEQNHPVYAAMVDSVDENLGRLLEVLDRNGASDNTVVILTSDHGGLSTRGLEHRRELATSNLPYRHGKGWLYDGGTRVPLVVRWPGKAKAGHVSNVQVTGTDHYQTILDLAGVTRGEATPQDSVSYLSALKGTEYERPPMFWHSSLGRPTQTGDTRSSSVIEGDWKLIQWYALENDDIVETQLFNLAEDPGERHDLAGAEPARRQHLESLLDTWKSKVNARLGEFKSGGI
jgi:arylsulfatase A-like enzyme